MQAKHNAGRYTGNVDCALQILRSDGRLLTPPNEAPPQSCSHPAKFAERAFFLAGGGACKEKEDGAEGAKG